MRITLPWPPSVNRYWRSVKGRVLISAAGQCYRRDVVMKVLTERTGSVGIAPVAMRIDAYYPDRRRRDIDNILKAPLDALTHAAVWADDSQIEALSIRKAGYDTQNPRLEVEISVL